jgi:hypothetical protein
MQENERPATIKVRLLDLRNQAFLAWYRIRTHLWYAHVFESAGIFFIPVHRPVLWQLARGVEQSEPDRFAPQRGYCPRARSASKPLFLRNGSLGDVRRASSSVYRNNSESTSKESRLA